MGDGLVSPGHLIVLLVVALIVFGPKRLPELGRSLGAGMRGFKDAISGDEHADPPVATEGALPESQMAGGVGEKPDATLP